MITRGAAPLALGGLIPTLMRPLREALAHVAVREIPMSAVTGDLTKAIWRASRSRTEGYRQLALLHQTYDQRVLTPTEPLATLMRRVVLIPTNARGHVPWSKLLFAALAGHPAPPGGPR